MTIKTFDVSIIGGGFSGICTAFHIIKEAKDKSLNLSIAIFEPRDNIGEGVAYGTKSSNHLLNVRASVMSITDSDPISFVNWIHKNKLPYNNDSYVPRKIYSQYLNEIFSELLNNCQNFLQFSKIQDEVVSIFNEDRNCLLTTLNGTRFLTKYVVLALGNLSATPKFLNNINDNCTLSSPWSVKDTREALEGENIAILGSGLTAVDTIIDLEAQNYQGNYSVISRHGAFPKPHEAPGSVLSETTKELAFKISNIKNIRSAFQQFRSAIKNGVSWAGLIDALRANTQNFWKNLPNREKIIFLKHLRSYWETHRHRVPIESIDKVSKVIKSGRLRIIKGVIEKVEKKDGTFIVSINDKRSGEKYSNRYNAAFDCTGLCSNITRSKSKLIKNMIDTGFASYDDLLIGLKTSDIGNIIGQNGVTQNNTYTLGPLRRGEIWETTAVREIREQANIISSLILRALI